MHSSSLLVLPLLLLIVPEGIDASKGISCFHCAGKPGQATWCERGANKSGVKKCPGDSLNPSNTCFKAVNKVTGEVTRGCAPKDYNHGVVQKISTGFDGNKDMRVYLCNKDYCNSGSSTSPLVALLGASLFLLAL